MKINITYKRVKRLSLRVTSDGDINVSAPYGTPKLLIDKFISDNKEWIVGAMKKQIAYNNSRAAFYAQLPLNSRAERDEAIAKLDAKIQPILLKYTKLMGVQPSKISYKPTISRWGACNSKSWEIQFSIYLLLLPEFCIEHIVVHELAHLIEANHGPRFHALMDKFFPRWREAKRETKQLVMPL